MEQMLTPYKILHLEPTDACQAACPQCAREFDTSFDKTNLHHLTLDQIKETVSDQQITQLDKMFMCGDYGDPAAAKNTLDIYRYFRHVNPNITLGMNTNGGLRATSWWRELGSILSRDKDYVVFSIDGTETTNHIYRVNVMWKKVMENAQEFIEAGGNAQWDMLVFEHNQHQVEECESLAKSMGFKWFRAKVSRRNQAHPVSFLTAPKGWKDPEVKQGSIKCQALSESSLYVSAQGKIFPCCYLGDSDYTLDRFDEVKQSWSTDRPLKACEAACLTQDQLTNTFSSQWQREIEFK